jgi:hypothetical protein
VLLPPSSRFAKMIAFFGWTGFQPESDYKILLDFPIFGEGQVLNLFVFSSTFFRSGQ